MGEQTEFDFSGIERKDEVFYARCRRKIKQALYLKMHQDGFTSMTDWFEQFVVNALGEKCKTKASRKKAQKPSKTSRKKQ